MSNNDELIIRFREMIGKKKSEDKTKSQESFFSGRNSQTKQTSSESDSNKHKDEIDENNRSNKNEYDEKSNVFMDRLRKMRNEIFEDEKENSAITYDKTIINEKINEGIDDNLENNINKKPRPSVFDLARRFEKKDKKQQIKTPDKKSETKFNHDNQTPNKEEEVIINPNEKIHSKYTIQNEDENFDLDGGEFRKYERISNSLNMMMNSLNKVKEEIQQRNSNILNVTNNSEMILNNSQIKNEFKDNIITDIPKRLVKDLIKMNEKRIRSNSENKFTRQRNTVSQRFVNNMSEIRGFMESLKENQSDKENLNEFMKKNEDKLKKFGIYEKDASVVQELIQFYEINTINASKENDNKRDQITRRQRNTVSNIGRTKSIVMDVDPIAEEKDDETSLAESWRKSNSERMSGQGDKNEINKSKLMQDILLNESVDSDVILAEDKLINIKIAGDEEVKEVVMKEDFDRTQHKSSTINTMLTEHNRNMPGLDANSHKKISENQKEKVFDSPKNEVKKENIMNISFPRPKKTFSYLSISKSNTSEIKLESKIQEYYKVNELSFNIVSVQKSSKNNPDKFKLHKQNQLMINSIPKKFNLKLSKQYTTSFINIKKPNGMSIHKINQLELNPKKDRNNELLMQEYNITDTTSDNKMSNQTFQIIDYENNRELKNLRSNSIDNTVTYINSNHIPPISTPPSQKGNPNFGKIIEHYQSNTSNSIKYHKNIINSLDSISILQYKLDSKIAFDPTFFDVLCTNCYECIKYDEIDLHSDRCVIQSEDNFQDLFDFKETTDEDYNSRIYKLYESLKNRHDEIYSVGNVNLNTIYEEFIRLIYEILLNNNSIEELDKSITKLNDLLNNKLSKIKSKYNVTLLVIGQRISQLVYIKLQEMENILLCVKANVEMEEFNKNDNLNIYQEFDEEMNPENLNEIEILKKELVHLEKQTFDTRKEIEEWRKESRKLENMLRRPIQNSEILSDIVSDVVSKREESFDEMTMVTGQTSEHDGEDIGNMRDFIEIQDVHNEEDLKKYFLSIGLSLKFRFGDKLKTHISIGDLYEKARKANIPISRWYNFIYYELVL